MSNVLIDRVLNSKPLEVTDTVVSLNKATTAVQIRNYAAKGFNISRENARTTKGAKQLAWAQAAEVYAAAWTTSLAPGAFGTAKTLAQKADKLADVARAMSDGAPSTEPPAAFPSAFPGGTSINPVGVVGAAAAGALLWFLLKR